MNSTSDGNVTGPFTPTVESLMNYRCPDWFRDAKFGIYVHWGPYSVPQRDEWYPRRMYMEGDEQYDHHVKTWGHPSKFGYKDFIPMWKAENWDPDRLVGLFKRAGARYFTPCAIHHDNFDLWNSAHHRFNSVNMGPKMDITGMWRKATLAAGLRFGVTTHLARAYSWFNTNKGADKHGPLRGVRYDGADPAWQDLYFEDHGDTDRRHPHNPPESWCRQWLARITDLIDNYHPDHLYFDGAIPFQGDDRAQTGMELLAHYYNHSAATHGGQADCVMCIKKINDHGYFFDGVATLDIERGKSGDILGEPWQTDTSIGPWGYRPDAGYRPVADIVHELVDIVSKNGNLLLNVPPRADGTLDAETEAILEQIGNWLDVNGEAIYATRPWKLIRDSDIRYTRKGTTLYAITPAWPEDGELAIEALGAHEDVGTVQALSLIGHDGELAWRQNDRALHVTLPPARPCDHAWALRIAGLDI